jgi:hypothetical protein
MPKYRYTYLHSTLQLEKFLGIPYKYNSCSFDYCDCWGLIALWYDSCNINLPIDTKEFYQNHPTHESINLLSLWRLHKGTLVTSTVLNDNSILVGAANKQVGLGLWMGDKRLILMTSPNVCSRLITWHEWQNMLTNTKILQKIQ